MYHELLFTLSGFEGPIFPKDQHGIFKVQKGLPFISESEESILNRILKIATHYYRINGFIAKYEICVGSSDEDNHNGLYKAALCTGLNEVLKNYRNNLINLEKDVLANPHLTISHFSASLNEYHLLFPAITLMLEEIIGLKAHGCRILEIVYQASKTGIPLVKNTMNQLLNVCHGVMYRQLTAWMLHGFLYDQYNEFFIKGKEEVIQTDSYNMDTEALEELSLRELHTSKLHSIVKFSTPSAHKSSNMKFYIDSLPSYIPTSIAEKILFIGESVEMFSRNISKTNENHESILKSKITDFSQEIHSLSKQEEFSSLKFDASINLIRDYTAEKLWSLVIIEGELIKNIGILKDFFLLGRGDLFLAFIVHAHEYLQYPPSTNTQYDLNKCFQLAASDIYFSDEVLLQKFQFVISGKLLESKEVQTMRKSESDDQLCGGWQQINLQYAVDWPLHIIFTPLVLEKYNSLFQFLLRVRKVQLELQQTWALSMRGWFREKNYIIKKYGWLRNHMIFLIDNLQYYLMVDVIESQFSILVDKIHKTKDYEAIQWAHNTFLVSLMTQSFLKSKHIFHNLNELMNLCLKFCTIISKACMDNKEYSKSLTNENIQHAETQIEFIIKNFKRHSNLLFEILLSKSKSLNHQSDSHVAQFMLRIDYNKFFTLAGGQLGSILQTSG